MMSYTLAFIDKELTDKTSDVIKEKIKNTKSFNVVNQSL